MEEFKSLSADLLFEGEDHAAGLSRKLLELYQSKQLTDVILKVEETEIHCHKVVLCAGSSHFHTMLTSGWRESSANVIPMQGVDADTLHTIVRYIYSGQVLINPSNAQALVQACDLYNLDALKRVCDQFMMSFVEISNCIGFYRFAKMYNLCELREKAEQTMMRQFSDVVCEPEFNSLEEADLIDYIGDDDLVVTCEDEVLQAVRQWMLHDPTARMQHMESVMQHVRLPYCSPDGLCDVARDDTMTSVPGLQKYFMEALVYHIKPDQGQTAPHESAMFRPRNCGDVDKRLVVIGGRLADESTNSTCWIRSPETGDWDYWTELPSPRNRYYSVCSYQGGVLLTGGNLSSNGTLCQLFDVKKKRWKSFPSMLEPRCFHATVSNGESVYAVGGSQKNEPLNSVERIGSDQRKWVTVPPMATAVRSPLCVSIGRFVYVCGGLTDFERTIYATCTQALDTVAQEWRSRADMPEACALGSAVNLRELIYIVGGTSRTCMSYDPRFDQWTLLQSPGRIHWHAAAIARGGRILLAGGYDGDKKATSAVEEFNPKTNSWELWQQPLKRPLAHHHLLSIDLIAGAKLSP